MGFQGPSLAPFLFAFWWSATCQCRLNRQVAVMSSPSQRTSNAGESSPKRTSVETPPWRWCVGFVVATSAAWVLLNYPPMEFDLPKELQGVDMYSPPKIQAAEKAQSAVLYWKNNLIKFGFVGLCFGAVPLLAGVGAKQRRRWVAACLGSVLGIACGLLVVVAGTYLRRYFDSGGFVPLVTASARPLVADLAIFMSASVLLTLPISLAMLVSGGKHRGQKAVSILLAGAVTGLVVPLMASILFPASQTNQFPPNGLALTATWLTVLSAVVFAFITVTGTRPAKAKSTG